MVKIYVPGVIHPFRCSEDLYEALVRAKIWCKFDRVNYSVHITSRNSDAPLTEIEKKRLRLVLCNGDKLLRVVFDN